MRFTEELRDDCAAMQTEILTSTWIQQQRVSCYCIMVGFDKLEEEQGNKYCLRSQINPTVQQVTISFVTVSGDNHRTGSLF